MKLRLHRSIAACIILMLSFKVSAQEDTSVFSKMSLNGYVKNLTTVFLPPGGDTSIIVDNLIHNRLDYAWYVGKNLTFNASMRNRLFFGESVKAAPPLYDMLADDLGFFDLSILWFNGNGAAFQSTFDRLNIDFQKGKWQVIAGRHRINWGVNLIWNPNDIFNTYSYFDFDYEERIGTDAILTRYYTGPASSLEVVYAPGDTWNEATMAGMYKFLLNNYDIQFLSGYLKEQFVVGCGWSGDIKGAGFRGEATLFVPGGSADLETQFVGSIDVDYTFTNSIYVHASYLFNSLGLDSKMGDYSSFFIANDISAQTLSPAMHNVFAEVAYGMSPIVRISLASWFNPADGSLFVGPTVDWSAADNFQVLFNIQGFVGREKTLFGDYGSFYYLRVRYSF